MKKFLVEVTSTFRLTFAVEAESEEEARLKVDTDELDDICQVHEGIIIKSAREATNEEIEEAADEYLKGRVIDLYFNENYPRNMGV